MNQTGWVKLYRSLRENPRASDPEWLALWVWMLLFANHASASVVWKGQRITLQPGQFTAGRKQIADATGICESKVVRLLNVMKTEQQIEQQTSNACSLFTILNWDKYQESEQRNEQPSNSHRTAIEQPSNTKQECKNVISTLSIGTEIELPPHFPVNEKAAANYCGQVGCPEEFARDTWNKAVSRGGQDSRGNVIRSFQHHLAIEWKYFRERQAKGSTNAAANAPGQPKANVSESVRVMTAQKELERLEARQKAIKNQAGADAWGPIYTSEQKKELHDLAERKKQLITELGCKV